MVKYNNRAETKKERKVDHVKWFESAQEGINSNKFIVVFDDGTIYVFFRDLNFTENKNNQIIRIPINVPQGTDSTALYRQLNSRDFQPTSTSPPHKEYTRGQLVNALQSEIESLDFDQYYCTPFK